VEETAGFEPAFRRAMAADGPVLLHLKLPTDVITSRTTLTALRAAAKKRRAGS
jgi:acetolactate synthase-1/2/3 large subunit